MLDELAKESDFVVGSRYAEVASTDDNLGMSAGSTAAPRRCLHGPSRPSRIL